MAEASTAVVVSEARPASHKTFWTVVIGVAVVLVTIVLLLPNKPNVFGGYSTRQLGYLLGVFYIAGLESGLSGFGFSGVAAAALALIPPILGTPLLQSLSTANQSVSIGQLKKDMPKSWKEFWAGPGFYIVGGSGGNADRSLAAYPFAGAAIDADVRFDPRDSTRSILCSSQPLFRSSGGGGPVAGIIVGFLGGCLGGFTAFPGAAVVVWSNLRKLPKAQNRAIVQPYIHSRVRSIR